MRPALVSGTRTFGLGYIALARNLSVINSAVEGTQAAIIRDLPAWREASRELR